MLKFVKNFFSQQDSAQKNPVLVQSRVVLSDSPRYPPSDNGLPCVVIDEILNSQSDLIDRIKKTSGLAKEDYERLFTPIIRNFANYVHLLPATNTSYHRGAGGLFRLGLELGLYSLQMANTTSFSTSGAISAEARYRNQPKWIYATFVAALTSEIYRPVSSMVVVLDDGSKWPQFISPLYEWLKSENADKYYVIWNAQQEDISGFQQANAAYMITSIVPQACLQYIADGNTDVILAMTSCVTGNAESKNNQISKIVSLVKSKIIKSDQITNIEHYGRQIVGSHLEPNLLDAMRRLIKDGTWTINTKGSRIWFSENDGFFIVWQAAARDIIKLMEKDGRHGIPQDGDTLADILINCGALEANEEDSRYWEIQVPVSMQLLNAVKVANPELFLQTNEIKAGEFNLLLSNEHNPESNVISFNPPSVKMEKVNRQTGEIKVESPPSLEVIVKSMIETHSKNDQAINSVEALPEVGLILNGNQLVTSESSDIKTPSKSVRMQAPSLMDKINNQPIKNSGASVLKPKDSSIVKAKPVALGSKSEELLAALKPPEKILLDALLHSYAQGLSRAAVFCHPHGMAISVAELNHYGNGNYTSFLLAMSTKKWIWEDTDNFPNGKKLHEVEHNGSLIKVMIFKSTIARELGFDWKIGATK